MSATALNDVAVVLAAHGDRGGKAPNAVLLAHRDALAGRGLFRHVAAGALRSDALPFEDALQQAHASGAARIAVYPMFMADGYFTAKVLPERIMAAGLTERCHVLRPLGLDPQMPELMISHALTSASADGLNPVHSRLLVVAHGSKHGRASLRSTERVACAIRRQQKFCCVETAYLEETPFLAEQLRSTPLTTIVLGFFSGDGMHASEDVPERIAQSRMHAKYAGTIGHHRAIPGVIEAAVRTALSTPA